MNAFWWALVAAGIWGVVPLIEKLGLAGTVAPTTGVLVRSLGVVIGMTVWCLMGSTWKTLGTVSLRSFTLLALGGFLASVVAQMAFYRALKTGQISYVTPIAGAYPLVAALLGWLVLREPLSAARLCGVVLIVLGVWCLGR